MMPKQAFLEQKVAGERNLSRVECHSTLDHPPSYGLMIVQRPGNGRVRFDIFEPCSLQGPVRAYIECVGLTKQPLKPQFLEIDAHAAANTFSPEALPATFGLD
jgi:hypothetical protein